MSAHGTSRVAAIGLAGLVAIALSSAVACNDGKSGARAYRATAPDQLIGGDVAMARVGDYVLENENVRFAILDVESSPAPGVFGGTLVDADLVRPEAEFRNGSGDDQLAEMIPVANLLWPRPTTGGVSIVSDGSDGGPAIVRVSGDAGVFLEALSLLRGDLLASLFPGTRFSLRIDTDYILEPGAKVLRVKSTATRTDPEAPNPIGDAVTLPSVTQSTSVFQTILGDADQNLAPGMLAGDFLFFGARNDIFAPGIGFDEEKPIFDALFQGQDTFTHPLSFDYMAAAGGNVSYGYFNLGDSGGAPPKVLVPIITSSSTGFITGAKNCLADDSDDATCDVTAAWTWERYFVVGTGDISSVADIVYATRGVPVGTVKGIVRGSNGQVVPNAHVYVMTDPEPATPWTDSYTLAEANYRASGVPGLFTQIDADPGRDPIEDGDFRASLPPGDYVVFAQDAERVATGPLQKMHIEAGDTLELAPVVPSPGIVRVRVTDQQGRALEAKLSFVAILADGTRAEGDGLRRPWLGEGRLGNGVRYMVPSLPEERGSFTEVPVEAGTYELVVSHGPEWSAPRVMVTVAEGRTIDVTVALVHEVDTRGWIAGDFHLHQEASFDSGMRFTERIRRVLVEGLELAIATDHDIVADLGPYVRKLGVQDRLKTGISAEVSTLELGHFIAFPLSYDQNDIPDHGAPDWTCLDGPGLMKLLKNAIHDSRGGVRIMAHPRDGFIGHISQIGLDEFGNTRELSLLEASNVLLARTTCEMDAMEVFNSKRFDLIRTPTNQEVVTFNRCLERIDNAESRAALDVACPELSPEGPLATCPIDERLEECKMSHRRRMAYLSAKNILIRTPEEQLANWTHVPGDDEDSCRPPSGGGEVPTVIADLPCVFHPGTYDDWMHWLDQGLNITITGASDSHGSDREPGVPRTFVRSDAATPQQIDVGAAAQAMTNHHALPSYGPFIDASVGGKIAGEVATVSGDTFDLKLRVQTASWFGVDRIEVYVSGMLEDVIALDDNKASQVVDFDGTVTLPVPDHDGFVSVIALGTREDLLMRPVSFDVFFGELQLPRVASLAFASIPAFALFFQPSPSVPDFFPVFPMAITNAILLDTDGDGQWAPPGPLPAFCERPCDPSAADADAVCEAGDSCLDSGFCGLKIDGQCVTGAPGTEQRYLNFE